MKWIQKRGCKWYITSGKWTISKHSVKGVFGYHLWKGNDIIGTYESAKEAKQAVMK